MTKQTLSDEDRKEIVRYRLEKSERTYKEALKIINDDFVEIVANRLYYSAYYAITALLIANGITVKSHSGVKAMFSLYFIKTHIIEKSYGVIFSTLFSLRMSGDYEDRRNLDMKTEVLPLVKPTKNLLDRVCELAKKSIAPL